MCLARWLTEPCRFRANPRVVGPPHVRFYACVPLVGTDAAIHGVLAIADCKPRRFATEQLAILTNFTELCMRKLEELRTEEPRETAAAAVMGQGSTQLLQE